MRLTFDARLPVTFDAGAAPPDAAYLVEHGRSAPSGTAFAAFGVRRTAHPPGCACCADRGPVAAAFDRLFLAYARGRSPGFARVVVRAATAAGRAAVAAALAGDPVVSARFRLEDETGPDA
jgi:hypothetical protein